MAFSPSRFLRAGHSWVTPATRQLFGALATTHPSRVSSDFFLGFLERNGLLRDDPRLISMVAELAALGPDHDLNLREFASATHTCSTLLQHAATGDLRVPDFGSLCDVVRQVYAEVEPNKDGENAQYIPQLAQVDPEQFSISVTTADGQHFSIGDADPAPSRFLPPGAE